MIITMKHIYIKPKNSNTIQSTTKENICISIENNSIPNECIVFLGKGTTSLNPLFCDVIESFRSQWHAASQIYNQIEKRLLKQDIFRSLYTTWLSADSRNVFLLSPAAGTEITKLLSEDEVLNLLPKKLYFYFRRYTLTHFYGVSFPDFVESATDRAVKDIIPDIPLHLPDKFIGLDEGTAIDHELLHTKMRTSKRNGGDEEKFRSGNNCYIDGALYSRIDKDVKVLDANDIGEFNIEFNMVGAKPKNSTVKVRWADTTKGLFEYTNDLTSKLKKMKGNARQYHLSSNASQYMMAFSENIGRTKTPYKSNVEFDSLPPTSLTLEVVAKLVDEVVRHKFQRTWNKALKLEKCSGQSLIGSAACHSLDVSVNLANAAHFDNGDVGNGVGVWMSKNCDSPDRWYFLLPNSSINGSKGVAIKLYHGLMIEWNGTEVKHCTMDPGDVGDNLLIGMLLGPKARFTDKRSSSKRPLLVATQSEFKRHML